MWNQQIPSTWPRLPVSLRPLCLQLHPSRGSLHQWLGKVGTKARCRTGLTAASTIGLPLHVVRGSIRPASQFVSLCLPCFLLLPFTGDLQSASCTPNSISMFPENPTCSKVWAEVFHRQYGIWVLWPLPDGCVYSQGARWDHVGSSGFRRKADLGESWALSLQSWGEEKVTHMGVQEGDFFFFKCFKNEGVAALIGVVGSQGARWTWS